MRAERLLAPHNGRMNQQQSAMMMNLAPFVADGLFLMILLGGGDTAVTQLQTPGGLNVVYLLVAYGLMCAGVYMLRKLQPAPDVGRWNESHPLLSRPARIVLGVLFGLAVMTLMAFQFGYFESFFQVNTLELGEGESAIFFVFAPGAWLGTSLLYTAFLALRVTPTVAEDDGRYPWLAFLGLLLVNGAYLFVAWQWQAIAALIAPAGLLGPGVLALLVFTLLFGPPRLVYLSRHRSWAGVTFVVVTAVAAGLVNTL